MCVFESLSECEWTHLGQHAFMWRGDSEARDAGGCQAGTLCGLFYTADLWHRPLLLLLLLKRWRQDLQVMLFLCNVNTRTWTNIKNTFMNTLFHYMCSFFQHSSNHLNKKAMKWSVLAFTYFCFRTILKRQIWHYLNSIAVLSVILAPVCLNIATTRNSSTINY